jgi:hypothetical protein
MQDKKSSDVDHAEDRGGGSLLGSLDDAGWSRNQQLLRIRTQVADLIFEIDVEFKRAFSCSSLPRTSEGKDKEGKVNLMSDKL